MSAGARRWFVWCLMVAPACGATDARVRPDPPCDPRGDERPVALPSESALASTCGNDRVDSYATACVERCTEGCGTPTVCSTDCSFEIEACDGTALGEATCASVGFAEGTLSCAADCSALDRTACDPCVDGACREIPLSARVAASEDLEVLVSGRGARRRVRAFWSFEELLFSAAVNMNDGSFAEVDALGAPLERWPVIATSQGFLAVVGSETGVELTVLDAAGIHRVPIDLPVDGGSVRAYARSDGEGAVLVQGELGSNDVEVRLIDARGRAAAWPSRAVIGIHPAERLVVVPARRSEPPRGNLEPRRERGPRRSMAPPREREHDARGPPSRRQRLGGCG